MMTRADIIVVVLGLFVGYFLVSWIVGKVKQGQTPASGPSEQGRPSDTNDQRTPQGDAQEKRPNTPRPWYDVLQVPAYASLDSVKLAYRRRMAEYHPDKVAGLGDELRALAETKSQEINAAYETALRAFDSRPA